MNIRTATLDDLDAIMALERASFPSDAWSEVLMREELTSRHGHYVVAEHAGRIIGYGGLRAPAGAREADVQTIALAESVRGHGRGRLLLQALLGEAVARRVREVFLDVRADNPVAHALYTAEGFTELGRRARYYQPDDVDAIVMRLDLGAWRSRVERDGTDAGRATDAGSPMGAAVAGDADAAGATDAGAAGAGAAGATDAGTRA